MEGLLGFLGLVLMIAVVVLQDKNQWNKVENSRMYKENLNLKLESLRRELHEIYAWVPKSQLEREQIEWTIQHKKEQLDKVYKELDEIKKIEQEKIDRYYNGK